MGDIRFNKMTFGNGRTLRPYISVSPENGKLFISKPAAKKIGLKKDERFEIKYIDSEHQLYVFKSNSPEGFQIKEGGARQPAFTCSSKNLCKALMDLYYPGETIRKRMLIGQSKEIDVDGVKVQAFPMIKISPITKTT